MKRQNRKWKAFTLIGPKDHDRAEGSWRERHMKSAFTLIELIVVMAVIGILVLLAAPKFLGYTQKAQETKHIHTAKVIETALEAYLINGGAFPDELEVVDKTLLEESAGKESLIGVNGYVTTINDETYYELTYDFIQKLDVKLSAKNKLLIEARASLVPTAVYASEKGIAMVDKEKTMKGYTIIENPSIIQPNIITFQNKLKSDKMSAGISTSIFINEDGKLYGAGRNGLKTLALPSLVDYSNFRQSTLIENAVKVEAGNEITFVITTDGQLLGFGYNWNGFMGVGNSDSVSYFPKVIFQDSVKDVKVGEKHVLVLKEDGTVWTWGNNTMGQLGNGTVVDNYTPTQVVGLNNIKKIEVGSYNNFAINDNGTIFSWGDSKYISGVEPVSGNVLIPQEAMMIENAIQVAAGHRFTIILKEDGTLWSVGSNHVGALGLGDGVNGTTVFKQIEGLENISEVIVARDSVLAKSNDGKVYVWGYNSYIGNLGLGDSVNRFAPVRNPSLDKMSKVALGAYHSFAVDYLDNYYSWGSNSYGQLGLSNKISQLTPTLITIE